MLMPDLEKIGTYLIKNLNSFEFQQIILLSFFNSNGIAIDTFSNKKKDIFYKFYANEMYPDYVLVYRDLSGTAYLIFNINTFLE